MSIFTVEIDGRPVIAFEAQGIEEASGICGLAEFRADMNQFTTGGVLVCPDHAVISVRPAGPDEVASFNRAAENSPVTDEMTMTFLIPIDGVVISVVDTGQ